MPAQFKLPSESQRAVVIGKTGSGKTQAATWMLSQKQFDRRPFFVMDFKLDDLLNDIPGIREHDLGSKLPKKPGLYITHPFPGDEDAVEEFLWSIWKRGNAGLFLDETYMIHKNSPAFRAILTQGRSKRIPVIMCTQRPVEISRFCFSESEFVYLMQLNDNRDYKTVQEFVPKRVNNTSKPFDITVPLPSYHGYYYDSAANNGYVMRPVPSRDQILDTFHDKLIDKRLVI
jgi:hypothetical protein